MSNYNELRVRLFHLLSDDRCASLGSVRNDELGKRVVLINVPYDTSIQEELLREENIYVLDGPDGPWVIPGYHVASFTDGVFKGSRRFDDYNQAWLDYGLQSTAIIHEEKS